MIYSKQRNRKGLPKHFQKKKLSQENKSKYLKNIRNICKDMVCPIEGRETLPSKYCGRRIVGDARNL